MTVAMWVLLWLMGQQSQSPSINGVLVRAGTSQGLPNEVVGLWPTTRIAKTDGDGQFKFANVAYGEYLLTVVHDGIKSQSPVILTSANRAENITLQVKPAPAIAGTVFDLNGERSAGTRIQALHTVYTPTGPRLQAVASAMTDDLGDFRLYWLRPGEYYVSASLNDREQKVGAAGLRLSPNLSKPDDGFPTIFFGGGYTPYQSQQVRLTADTDVDHTHIFLKDGPLFNVTVRLTSPGMPTCARVAIVPEGGFVTEKDFVTQACDSLTVRGLSAGTYFILAVNDGYASEVTRITVGNPNLAEFVVTLVRSVNISGRVSGATSRVRLVRNTRDISQEFETAVEPGGSFFFTGIGPGNYDAYPELISGDLFISSINYNRSNALSSPFRVDPGVDGRLDIQIAASDLVAEGVVVDRSLKPVPGAQVVLVPRSMSRFVRADRYLTAIADAGGNFQIRGIPPGETYLVLAFEDLEPGAYYAFSYIPDLVTRYVSAGQAFSVSSAKSMQLFAIPASQTVGGLR